MSIQENPDSVCENDVNNEQNVGKTIEREVDYSTVKKKNEKLIILL